MEELVAAVTAQTQALALPELPTVVVAAVAVLQVVPLVVPVVQVLQLFGMRMFRQSPRSLLLLLSLQASHTHLVLPRLPPVRCRVISPISGAKTESIFLAPLQALLL
jgi:hypothetical protein